jgi:CheY-like chemotaxis protein
VKLQHTTFLIVDDEEQLRVGYALWLRRSGAKEVYTAADGVGALEILKQHTIDFLISDVRMPVMDGVALIRSLRRMPGPIPKIILISGFSLLDQEQIESLGVETLLSKPIALRELHAAILKSLDS